MEMDRRGMERERRQPSPGQQDADSEAKKETGPLFRLKKISTR
jgi:hypothetical protein